MDKMHAKLSEGKGAMKLLRNKFDKPYAEMNEYERKEFNRMSLKIIQNDLTSYLMKNRGKKKYKPEPVLHLTDKPKEKTLPLGTSISEDLSKDDSSSPKQPHLLKYGSMRSVFTITKSVRIETQHSDHTLHHSRCSSDPPLRSEDWEIDEDMSIVKYNKDNPFRSMLTLNQRRTLTQFLSDGGNLFKNANEQQKLIDANIKRIYKKPGQDDKEEAEYIFRKGIPKEINKELFAKLFIQDVSAHIRDKRDQILEDRVQNYHEKEGRWDKYRALRYKT